MANFGDNFVKNNAIQSLVRAQRDTENSEVIKPTTTTKPVDIPHGSTTKRILCVWLPNWPTQRLVVAEPDYRRQQVILFRRDSRRGQVVAAVSPLAMRSGVCIDMPLSEAKSLLRAGGDFHVLEHDPTCDLQAIEELADSLECFSPIVGLETIEENEWKRGRRPDSILLEVTGLAHLFGDETELARKVLQYIDDLGYLPRIAIGDTVAMAWAASRYLAGAYFRQHQEPVVLPPGDQETIQQLPVQALRLEATIADTLFQLGIATIGQLQQLSRNDLAMRFGNSIHKRMDQITGKSEEPVIARHRPATFVAEQLLEFPTHHRETIEVIIARLVTQLCAQMRGQQRGALEWLIKLTCVAEQSVANRQDNAPIEFRVNLFQPTATCQHVMPLVEMQLEQVLSPHTKKVRKNKKHKQKKHQSGRQNQVENGQTESKPETSRKDTADDSGTRSVARNEQFHRYTTIQIQEITVSVTSDVLLVQQQRKLFDENPRLDRQSLAHLINRLASRMGTENVVYPVLQSGAQPEYSFRWKPLVDPTRKQRRRRTKPPKLSHALARPLRLFHPAKKVEVEVSPVSPGEPFQFDETSQQHEPPVTGNSPPHQRHRETPTHERFRPASIRTLSTQQSKAIVNTWGPERIETGWWRGRTVCRDYWRVETEARQHFWIYRDLRSSQWFLHGEF